MIDPRGLQLLTRYAQGEPISESERASLRATMYLIQQTVAPPRTWEKFNWEGEEAFMRRVWPLVRERYEISSGQFAHGAVRP